MLNLGKVILGLALSIGWLYADGVEATVSNTQVNAGDVIELRIKATGNRAAFPDIERVDDAPVMATSMSSSQNIVMINGNYTNESSTTKSVQFVPEHDMVIPAYTVNIGGKNYKTKPINIQVVDANTQTAKNTNATEAFTLKMIASKPKVLVGESLSVTVLFALHNSVRLAQDVQYKAPTFPGFVVADTKQQAPYMKDNYQVQEVTYILTAQAEGNYTFGPAGANVGLPQGRSRDIFGMAFGTKWKQLVSNALEVEVAAQTQKSDLVGDFSINATINTQETKPNKPVNLQVTIEGKGSLENFEFPKYEIDGVTVYSDEAKVETKVVDGELHSTLTKSFAFIAEEDFTIPARHFSVLTPKEQSLKELTVDSYAIHIKKSTPPLTSEPLPPKQGLVQSGNEQPVQTKEVIVEKQVEVKTVAWWMVALAFASGVLVTLLAQWLPSLKHAGVKSYSEEEALKLLYAHVSESSDIEAMVRKLYAKKQGDKSVKIDKKALKGMVERLK